MKTIYLLHQIASTFILSPNSTTNSHNTSATTNTKYVSSQQEPTTRVLPKKERVKGTETEEITDVGIDVTNNNSAVFNPLSPPQHGEHHYS